MPLPVAVAVPHVVWRKAFFLERCLPTILESDPQEIIIVPNDGSTGRPGIFRNAAFERTRAPFVYFVDDDTVLLPGGLLALYEALSKAHMTVAIAYGNYRLVAAAGSPWSRATGVVSAGPWDKEKLLKSNFIPGVALVRSECYLGCDETLRRLVDWDLWIRMARAGMTATWVDRLVFEAHQIDRSVTLSMSDDQALEAVRKKNDLWR